MTEALWGVLIGGFIAGILPAITIYVNYEQWKREKKIQYLTKKHKKLELLYEKSLKKLGIGYGISPPVADMITEEEILMPENIRRACCNFIIKADNSEEKIKNKEEYIHELYLEIADKMKESLREIETQLESLFSYAAQKAPELEKKQKT